MSLSVCHLTLDSLEIVEHGLHIGGIMDVLAEARFPHNPHAQVTRDLGQAVNKVLQVLRFDRLLRGEAGYGPILKVFYHLKVFNEILNIVF